MLTRLRVGTPAGLSILFVLLAGIPLAALGWLGSRLLASEREVERQQRRELLDNSTAILTHEIDRSLSRWDDAAAAGTTGATAALPPDTVLLVFDSRGVVRSEGIRLPYVPAVITEAQPPGPDLAASGSRPTATTRASRVSSGAGRSDANTETVENRIHARPAIQTVS